MYASVADLRDEGVSVAQASDARLLALIDEAGRAIDSFTGWFFEPRNLTLRLDGQLVELRESDLRFDRDEVGRFFARFPQVELDDRHVQRLAERSTNATKQIEVLVRTIQSDTNEAVVSMERSTTDVVGGALLAENAGAALDEIEQVSNQIANLVQNISGSAREQASSAADVTRRTARLKEISDQTGKATTATAAAISKLSILASQLRQTVAGFTLPNSAFESSAFAAKRPAPVPETLPKDKVAG